MTNSTLSGNSATSGGGIFNYTTGRMVTLTNTIVAGNTLTGMGGSGPDLSGTFMSGGHNLISDSGSSSGITNGTKGDIVNNMPLLGTLSNNGGTTQTIPLMPGSPAIAHGDTTVCNATTGIAPVGGQGPARRFPPLLPLRHRRL